MLYSVTTYGDLKERLKIYKQVREKIMTQKPDRAKFAINKTIIKGRSSIKGVLTVAK